jgi:hypothetical protein
MWRLLHPLDLDGLVLYREALSVLELPAEIASVDRVLAWASPPPHDKAR